MRDGLTLASADCRRVPSRWTLWAALAIAAGAAPANIWRLALTVGVPVGYDDDKLRNDFDLPGWSGALHLVALVLVTQGLALSSLGLVGRWGETAPAWVPRFGGRRIPAGAVVALAGAGAVLLTLLWVPVGLLWWSADTGLDGAPHVVAGLCYLPMVLWGPLLGALTVSYRRRRRT